MLNGPDSGVFAPEDVDCLKQALDRAWPALARVMPEEKKSFEARRVQMLLAERIILLAEAGERDPRVLAAQALAWLPIYREPERKAPPSLLRRALSSAAEMRDREFTSNKPERALK